jgi:hypothetical protein
MNFQQYGISPQTVERIKKKLQDPEARKQVQHIFRQATKADLQNRAKVKSMFGSIAAALGVKIAPREMENIVSFVIAQKIDPRNLLHLLKALNMFH